ncbi:unnamed protein product [Ceratitis capitata]|uniref:(Mediterranean fruit fly) hypothetical protein n=1 Tax=Ceratitis capitata TaxID=7213 RepID=A0A811UVQ0_CERCA|nr:unnamed protein product [Ceratitis capitata]
MPKEDKLHYIEEAFHAPKKRKPPSIQIQPQPNQMCAMPYQSDRGIVCPRMPTACPKKRRRKAKCARRRKPKKGDVAKNAVLSAEFASRGEKDVKYKMSRQN